MATGDRIGIADKATLDNVKNTAICILSDKEEIGSMGNTGMESHMFDFFISEILNKLGINRPNLLDKVFCFSKMLSSDVDAGFDPIYASVSDKLNAGFLGNGISLNKYTGGGGKYDASDANAEYVAWVRNILEKNDIRYQVTELGKAKPKADPNQKYDVDEIKVYEPALNDIFVEYTSDNKQGGEWWNTHKYIAIITVVSKKNEVVISKILR